MTDRKLRIGSLFAGVGGFDLGFRRAGFETAWAVEIDEKAQAVLRLRFPEAELHDDVTKVGAHNLAPVDVITYGFPCQDLSVAGKRAGLEGARSGLFHEAVRVICELRARDGKPDIAIAENVPGLFSSNGGRDFAVVLQTLVDVGARDVAWRVLDSQHFAVAQRRKRVFIVSDFGGERAAEILSFAKGVRGDTAKGGKKGQGAARGAGKGAPSGGRVGVDIVGTLCSDTHPGAYSGQDAYTGRLVPQFFDEQASGSQYGTGSVASTCSTRDCKDATDLVVQPVCATGYRTHALTVSDGATEDGTGRGTPIVPAIAFHPTQDPISSVEVTHALGAGSKGGCAAAEVATEITGTLGARASSGGGFSTDFEVAGGLQPVGAMAVRRLTPTETARLQAFPDDWNAHGLDKNYRQVLMKDGNRYKQMGNAVTVNVAHAIAERVAAVLRKTES